MYYIYLFKQKTTDEIRISDCSSDVCSSDLLYIRLIEECIEKGKQALYLLPEIAITEQMTRRLKAYFGNKLAVYHSRFNDNERGEIWKNVLQGTRSDESSGGKE